MTFPACVCLCIIYCCEIDELATGMNNMCGILSLLGYKYKSYLSYTSQTLRCSLQQQKRNQEYYDLPSHGEGSRFFGSVVVYGSSSSSSSTPVTVMTFRNETVTHSINNNLHMFLSSIVCFQSQFLYFRVLIQIYTTDWRASLKNETQNWDAKLQTETLLQVLQDERYLARLWNADDAVNIVRQSQISKNQSQNATLTHAIGCQGTTHFNKN